jgi:radical SAM protein with 4Fe4S-binding SPASM domain
MNHITACLSMLHEDPTHNSATRIFRQDPVLCWTLDRLSQSKQLTAIAVLCWEDQLDAVKPIASEAEAYVLVKGPRQSVGAVEAIASAQKFADGWRGGLLGTCDFDNGFHGPWSLEILNETDADAIVLVDPSSGLVDAALIDEVISHAKANEDSELVFAPVAPGLAGPLIRKSLLERLSSMHLHPGRVLHYLPDQPMREPLSGEGCVPVSPDICRTTRRFKLDSQRQVQRITNAAVSLNGTLIKSSAQELLHRVNAHDTPDTLPRDVTIELTTHRNTRPIYSPLAHLSLARPPMSIATAKAIFEQLAAMDDIRITFGGVGDPLLHPEIFRLIEMARESGIDAVHLETDLLCDHLTIEQLAKSDIDVVTIFEPALNTTTYRDIMGVDGLQQVIENVRHLVHTKTRLKRHLPLVVPTFVKMQQNLGEMESWYDQWLRVVGSATIVGPSDCAGQIPFSGIADMSPPRRKACMRLSNRMTILSDGSIVACEQDVTGKMLMGNAGTDRLSDVWMRRFNELRNDHASGEWTKHPLCVACKEWHRP